MSNEENEFYFKKIDEIGQNVYDFYNMSDRKDLIMVYEMPGDKIYSYIYEEYKASLNERSQAILESQYKEAIELKKIVLFIQDNEREKLKSFLI